MTKLTLIVAVIIFLIGFVVLFFSNQEGFCFGEINCLIESQSRTPLALMGIGMIVGSMLFYMAVILEGIATDIKAQRKAAEKLLSMQKRQTLSEDIPMPPQRKASMLSKMSGKEQP